MLKLIKKVVLILLLLIINFITYTIKIIYNFFQKNKMKIKKYSNGICGVLKEEIQR